MHDDGHPHPEEFDPRGDPGPIPEDVAEHLRAVEREFRALECEVIVRNHALATLVCTELLPIRPLDLIGLVAVQVSMLGRVSRHLDRSPMSWYARILGAVLAVAAVEVPKQAIRRVVPLLAPFLDGFLDFAGTYLLGLVVLTALKHPSDSWAGSFRRVFDRFRGPWPAT